MNAAIVIPTYWAQGEGEVRVPGSYDHSTPLTASHPELENCLSSLEQVRSISRIILLTVCPVSATTEVARRVRAIAAAHESLPITVVTNVEAAQIADRVAALSASCTGECVSLRGYGAIRNMGLAVAAILGHDAVVFLDDDEVVLGPDFLERALYGLGQETRARQPILAKTGYFFDRAGSPLADTSKKTGICSRWWTKRIEFNRWMKRALAGRRISRSNYVCGGCMALHARAYTRIAFDPFITRGEDLDYLFNVRLFGLDVWFDSEWVVKHLPPQSASVAPRFMQNVYRWYYEREKLAFAARLQDLNAVTAASLMPYPGPWISVQLDERVRKTALARMLFTREHRAYATIWRHGRDAAERYARENADRYFRFQSFWPRIMDSLWCDERLAKMLEGSR